MSETILTRTLCVVCSSVFELVGAAVMVYVLPEVKATLNHDTALPLVSSIEKVLPPQKFILP